MRRKEKYLWNESNYQKDLYNRRQSDVLYRQFFRELRSLRRELCNT